MICLIKHDCNDNCVNFLNTNDVFLVNESDKLNERRYKRFKFGNSVKICKNVFDVNFDDKYVVENINSSK